MEDELVDHVIMAIDGASNGKTGCAYYVARHALLYCMQDIESGSDITEALKIDIEPTVVLLSSRVNDSTAGVSQRQGSLVHEDAEDRPLPYITVVRPTADFKYESAIQKLSSLNIFNGSEVIRFLIPGENMDFDQERNMDELGLIDQHGKLLSTTGSLDLDCRFSVGCAGAVIGYLQRLRSSEYLEHDPRAQEAYRITRIEMFTLRDTMLLNVDALSSLQIIQSETHPNLANQGPSSSGAKESLSVYGLFLRFAKTPQGRARLRQMILRPSLRSETISERHEFITAFTKPDNQMICDSLSKNLRGVKNMQTTLTSLRKGAERGTSSSNTIKSGVWAALLEFCYHCIDIRDKIEEVIDGGHLDILTVVGHVLEKSQLQHIGRMVHDVIDLDESLEQNRTVVKRGIDQDLDMVKETYDGMEDTLTRIANEIMDQMPSEIDERLNVVYLPQLGFHVTVPLGEATNEAIWHGDEGWERRFKTEKNQYFKNDKMREMDTQWGDLHTIICDTEIEISHRLAQQVLENEAWLIEASNYCGELDSMLALAQGALQYKLVRPKMIEDNIIDIRGGRHILQEMTVASYVPNDTFLAGGDELHPQQTPSMIMLTGPNYSGKSVYMKQVALIVYLAQIGSFVPAESATLGLTDKIFTRINTAESVSKMQSAFMVDLQQVSLALKSSTNRSLLIIDEFGKGTDICDGAGLASGIFKFLLSLGAESPRVLASTHFHEIFERGDFDGYDLKFGHLEVQVDPSTNRSNASTVTYLYNLREGRSKLSYGSQCAAINGIPDKIIDRAILLADLMIRGQDLVATCSAMSRSEAQELEDAEAVCREFLDKEFTDGSLDVRQLLEGVFEVRADESMH